MLQIFSVVGLPLLWDAEFSQLDAVLETASTSIGVMTPGRFVAGFGVGFISAIGES